MADAISVSHAARIVERLFPSTQRMTSCLIIPRPGDLVPLIEFRAFGRAVVQLERYAIVPREWVNERSLKDRQDAATVKHAKRERRKQQPRPSLSTLRKRAKLWQTK